MAEPNEDAKSPDASKELGKPPRRGPAWFRRFMEPPTPPPADDLDEKIRKLRNRLQGS
jgi:hypothetical protein